MNISYRFEQFVVEFCLRQDFKNIERFTIYRENGVWQTSDGVPCSPMELYNFVEAKVYPIVDSLYPQDAMPLRREIERIMRYRFDNDGKYAMAWELIDAFIDSREFETVNVGIREVDTSNSGNDEWGPRTNSTERWEKFWDRDIKLQLSSPENHNRQYTHLNLGNACLDWDERGYPTAISEACSKSTKILVHGENIIVGFE